MANKRVTREFIRRMAESYEERMTEVINNVPDCFQKEEWTEDLMLAQDLKEMTHDPFLNCIEF